MRVRPAVLVMTAVSRVAPGLKPRIQKSLIRSGYELLNRGTRLAGTGVMNYGYAPLGPEPELGDAPDRFGLELYRRVAGAVDLTGTDVLEVGCGRGGGAAFVLAHMGAGSVTGVDFAERAIAHCNRSHRARGLRFLRADAERLPFPPGSFDAVLSVESSHCYPSVERFLGEVHRVLRPGGHLLLADLRPRHESDALRGQFAASGLATLDDERITANVVRALDLDGERRTTAVRRLVPRPLHRVARDFLAVRGSEVWEDLNSGNLEYLRFVLQKAPPRPARAHASPRQAAGPSGAGSWAPRRR